MGEKEREYNSLMLHLSNTSEHSVTGSGDTSVSSVFASHYIGVGRGGGGGGGGGSGLPII